MTYQRNHAPEPLASDPIDPRPTCAVKGMIQPRAMCGAVIVGGKFCGFAGECRRKQVPGMAAAQPSSGVEP